MSTSTQTSLAERTLGLAHEVLGGGGSLAELGELLGQLSANASAAHNEFVENARNNPELAADFAEQVGAAMQAYHEALEQMRAAVKAERREDLAEPLETAEQMRLFVLSAQMQFQYYLEHGATIHPYLNRVLLHIDYFAGDGQETQHTVGLMPILPSCIKEIADNLVCIQDPNGLADAESALEQLQERCNEFFQAVRSGWDDIEDHKLFLTNLREEIVVASDRIASALGGQLEQDLAADRTPLAPVNLVMALADRLAQGTATPEQFLEGIALALDMLDTQVPEGADETLVEAANAVRSALDRLIPMAEKPDAAVIETEKQALNEAAQELAMVAAVMAADDTLLDVVSGEGLTRAESGLGRGLPPMLGGLLQLGEAFAEGTATREDLEQGIQNLDALVTRTQSQVASARDTGQAQKVEESLVHLRAASDAMWSLADSGDREHLAEAEQAMLSASDVVKTFANR